MADKIGTCCYCGSQKEMTDEHVVPKGLYLNDHGVVIPCCKDCNNGKAMDDEYFILVFAVLKESKDHPIAQKVLKKVKRALNNPDKEEYADMIQSSANNILSRDKEGKIVEKETGLDVEIIRINRVFKFITKGLFFLETGSRLNDNYRAISTFGMEGDSKDGDKKLREFRKKLSDKPWEEIGNNGVFKYRHTFAIDPNASQSLWEMQIYQGRRIISFIEKKNFQ